MPSLAILVTSFFSTLALAASPRGLGPVERETTTSVCLSQKPLIIPPDDNFPLTDDWAFTLLAVSKANASVRTPLVVEASEDGGAWLATDGSDNIIARKFYISNGGIIALDSNENNVAVSNPVESVSSSLTFLTPAGPPPAQSYCEFISLEISTTSSPPGFTDSYAYNLAVTLVESGGDSKNFSLCTPSQTNMDGSAPVVIYAPDEATANEGGYIDGSCDPVDIYMLPS